MERPYNAINLRLSDTRRTPVVLLGKNHLDTSLVRKHMNNNPILSDLRIAELKPPVALVLQVKYPCFSKSG